MNGIVNSAPSGCLRIAAAITVFWIGILGVLGQNPSQDTATLRITKPPTGERYRKPAIVQIECVAVDPNGSIRHVEFFANDQLIGVSDILTRDADIPGRPRTHHFTWVQISAGGYTIVARAKSADGTEIVSPSVQILVEPPSEELPVVRLVAKESEVLEAQSDQRLTFVASRTGDISEVLTVYYKLEGSATWQIDYVREGNPPPPNPGEGVEVPNGYGSIEFEAGSADAALVFHPVSDKALEGDETVVVELIQPVPPLTARLRQMYRIGSPDTAKGVIRESQVIPRATIVIHRPREGATFPASADIDIRATAIDPAGYISRIELFANGVSVGVSEIVFIQAPDPGTPIEHELVWKDVKQGKYVLTAKSQNAAGGEVVSAPVTITVGRPSSSVASIVISRPRDGQEFKAPSNIEIEAKAVDPAGYLPHVVFTSNGQKVGESTITFIREPDPGSPIHHEFRWEGVAAGEYLVAAYTELADGSRVESKPVKIHVVSGPVLPSVTVEVADATAAEPTPSPDPVPNPNPAPADTGKFLLKRTGDLSRALVVYYSVSGSADNGKDFARLDGDATIAAGESRREIVVTGLPDQALEGPEVVTFSLKARKTYSVGTPEPVSLTIQDAQLAMQTGSFLIISAPATGTAYKELAEIHLEAGARDTIGIVPIVDFYANDQKIGTSDLTCATCLYAPGSFFRHKLVWSKVAAGLYRVTAKAVSSSVLAMNSDPITLIVREELKPFVSRALPDNYQAGVKISVTLDAKPVETVQNYAIEETPPRGWQVANISHGGVWDAVRGRVKFGPYFDHDPRTLTYDATAPADARRNAEFSGAASADGSVVRVAGDQVVKIDQRLHPADNNPGNNAISLKELTDYGAAWKSGIVWPIGPSPIPMSYVTRAAALWSAGETYVFDPSAGPDPMGWVTPPRSTSATRISNLGEGLQALFNGLTRRPIGTAITEVPVKGKILEEAQISIRIYPPEDTAGYALEEHIPASSTVIDISDNGVFDSKMGLIRWGPFLDDEKRTLTFVARTLPTSSLSGTVSFDGQDVKVIHLPAVVFGKGGSGNGDNGNSGKKGPRIAHVERLEDGEVELLVVDDTASGCEIQVSNDLKTWRGFDRSETGLDSSVHYDTDAEESGSRFYRLKDL